MKKMLILLLILSSIGIYSSLDNQKNKVEIIYVSQINKAQQEHIGKFDHDIFLYLGWLLLN